LPAEGDLGQRTTVNVFTDGVGSGTPASTARTWSLCLPGASFLVFTTYGDVHGFQARWSRRHSNVAPGVGELKV
jgi:hypothetical protein